MDNSARSPKRLASALLDVVAPSKRPQTFRHNETTSAVENPLTAVPSAMEIRAFGLEDRAEAVISRGKESWTLANLSKWRHDSLDKAATVINTQLGSSPRNYISSKEYLKQRQRAYRQQILATRELVKQPDS